MCHSRNVRGNGIMKYLNFLAQYFAIENVFDTQSSTDDDFVYV